MFINTVYRLPIWYDIDTKSRNIRILILGIILYIITHSFIYSKYVDNYQMVLNYRNYIYYLIALDLTIVGFLMFTNKKIKKNININKKKLKKFNNLPNNHMGIRQFNNYYQKPLQSQQQQQQQYHQQQSLNLIPNNFINNVPEKKIINKFDNQPKIINKPKIAIKQKEIINKQEKSMDMTELPIYNGVKTKESVGNILDTELPIYKPHKTNPDLIDEDYDSGSLPIYNSNNKANISTPIISSSM